MAPLPHNNTDLFYLDYSTGTVDHTMEVRTGPGVATEAVIGAIDDFLTAITSTLKLITVLGFRYQAAGTDISNEIAWTGPGTYGSGAADAQDEASFISYVGRGTTGRRAKVSVFGFGGVNDRTGFRVSAASNAAVQAGLDVLEAADGVFYDIDGGAPNWKQYANVGLSSYWQRKFR